MSFKMSGNKNNKAAYYEHMMKHVHCCTAPSRVNVTIKDYYNEPKIFINGGYKNNSVCVTESELRQIFQNSENIFKSIDECNRLCDEKQKEETNVKKRKHNQTVFEFSKDAAIKVEPNVEVEQVPLLKKKKKKNSSPEEDIEEERGESQPA